jgi:LDH2 family malate/lactate/ureidoglycolate dehydrogenase
VTGDRSESVADELTTFGAAVLISVGVREDDARLVSDSPVTAAWQQVAARCVVPGSHVNTYCRPLGPDEESTP